MAKKNQLLSATVDGNRIRLYDAQTGSLVKWINVNKPIISSPVVAGDRLTVQVQTNAGQRHMHIYKLPGGTLSMMIPS
tara:strand:+ start:7303 stop:7536 length:234 start_codon:yes stop_codon:yes gene_type:complete